MRYNRRKFEESIAKEAKTQPQKTWKYIRSNLKVKEEIGNLYKSENDKSSQATTNHEKGEILSDFFCKCIYSRTKWFVTHTGKSQWGV